MNITEIRITKKSDWKLFDEIAARLEKQGIVFTKKNDGEEQRY